MRPAWLLLGALLTACVRVPLPPVGTTEPPSAAKLGEVIGFDFPSLDDRSVSAPAFRGKPAVIVFLVSDSLAGQVEMDIVSALAKKSPDAARYAFVAVEPPERRELVMVFRKFFEDKTGVSLLGAMADKDTLDGQGPFGDVRALTVVVLDAGGRLVFRASRVVPGVELSKWLAAR